MSQSQSSSDALRAHPFLHLLCSDHLGARVLRGLFFLTLWLWALRLAVAMVAGYHAIDHIGFDSHAYWSAIRQEDPYDIPPGHRDAYLYSPAFLQVITPIALLPWPAFFATWIALELSCFLWLTRAMAWRWRFPVLALCTSEMLYGNIHAFLAVMVCLGLRRPGLWAFALLTKVTLGFVGLVWFIARGEWKKLSEVLAVTAVITGISALANPDSWVLWLEFLTTGSDGESHDLRLTRIIVVLGILVFAARGGATWVLPIAMLWTAPRFSLHIKDLSILAALPRMLRQHPSGDDARSTPIAKSQLR